MVSQMGRQLAADGERQVNRVYEAACGGTKRGVTNWMGARLSDSTGSCPGPVTCAVLRRGDCGSQFSKSACSHLHAPPAEFTDLRAKSFRVCMNRRKAVVWFRWSSWKRWDHRCRRGARPRAEGETEAARRAHWPRGTPGSDGATAFALQEPLQFDHMPSTSSTMRILIGSLAIVTSDHCRVRGFSNLSRNQEESGIRQPYEWVNGIKEPRSMLSGASRS
jgi:hypothetical protein